MTHQQDDLTTWRDGSMVLTAFDLLQEWEIPLFMSDTRQMARLEFAETEAVRVVNLFLRMMTSGR